MSSSKEVIKKIEQDGWYIVRVVGSHHHYKHPTRKGKVTVPHPKKDLPRGTERSILKQAGLL
ncbi:addiction module toxin, HicA family [Staphylococcus chromogenes]|uniref:type II toxin-antitoxin system HicA family toxin n=1 Tax=Staphylococcus chromogenes TaxID=46126 RepID=UPI001405611A|nr:type II toxin-antitoxin system HicA family toxin [Staphylococcus chromogenes]QIN26384.1 addiction module toxin, HicA family [Staphylococcus chromogenes]